MRIGSASLSTLHEHGDAATLHSGRRSRSFRRQTCMQRWHLRYNRYAASIRALWLATARRQQGSRAKQSMNEQEGVGVRVCFGGCRRQSREPACPPPIPQQLKFLRSCQHCKCVCALHENSKDAVGVGRLCSAFGC
jgi:hypothetical protein